MSIKLRIYLTAEKNFTHWEEDSEQWVYNCETQFFAEHDPLFYGYLLPREFRPQGIPGEPIVQAECLPPRTSVKVFEDVFLSEGDNLFSLKAQDFQDFSGEDLQITRSNKAMILLIQNQDIVKPNTIVILHVIR